MRLRIQKSWRIYASFVVSIVVIISALFGATFYFRAKDAHAADTGTATLDSVVTTQVGTGLTGEDATHVLINNDVKWAATFSIITPGTITLTATLPRDSYFDAASVASLAGCDTGSAVSNASSPQQSRLPNVATCIINPTLAGSFTWNLSAGVTGANGVQVIPEITISGAPQSYTPPTVILVGAPSYQVQVVKRSVSSAVQSGEYPISIGVGLRSPTNANGVLGIEPISSGAFSVDIDMSEFPAGWTASCSRYGENGVQPSGSVDVTGATSDSTVVYSGSFSCTKLDESTLRMSTTDAPTGILRYPSFLASGAPAGNWAWWSVFSATIWYPIAGLTGSTFSAGTNISNAQAQNMDGSSYIPVISPNTRIQWDNMPITSRLGLTGSVYFYEGAGSSSTVPPGFQNAYDQNRPLPSGTVFRQVMRTVAYSVNTTYLENVEYCMTFSGAYFDVSGDLTRWTADVISGIEYGYYDGGTGNGFSAPSASSCGTYSDGNPNFYTSRTAAQSSLATQGKLINVVRFRYDTLNNITTNTNLAYLPLTARTGVSTVPVYVTFGHRVTADDQGAPLAPATQTASQYYVPGLLSHSILTSNSESFSPQAVPGTTQHFTVTPNLLGLSDTNATITITMPGTLTPIAGSYTWGGTSISPASITPSAGDNIITFNLGTIDQTLISTSPTLQFDAIVDPAIPIPTTVTVSSAISGDGSQRAVLTYRTAATSFPVTIPPPSFGYIKSQYIEILQPGDSQTYVIGIYNTTPTPITNTTFIDVLPWNGDPNGTSGLIDRDTLSSTQTVGNSTTTNYYDVSDFSIVTLGASNLSISYTTDLLVRTDPANAGITWTPHTSGALPAGITAIRFFSPSFSSGAMETATFTLSGIAGINNANLANALTLVTADTIPDAHNAALASATYKRAVISGTVYNDVDGNGAFAGADTPLSGKTVSLRDGGATGTVLATTTTDVSGAYTFDFLREGTYSITTTAPTDMEATETAISFDLAMGGSATKNLGFILITLDYTIAYDITIPTLGPVKACVTFSVPISSIGATGWAAPSGDTSNTVFCKSYTVNTIETIPFYDNNGRNSTFDVVITNIRTAPTASFAYSETAPTLGPVTVTMTASRAINTPSGWTDSGDHIHFTRVLTTNTDGEVTVNLLDLENIPGTAKYQVSNIRTPLTATVSYSDINPTNEEVIATITPNRAILTPAGWTKVNATTFIKSYPANATEIVPLEDFEGFTTSVTVNIQNIFVWFFDDNGDESGRNDATTISTGSSIIMVIKRPFALFTGDVEVNGVLLNPSDFTAEDGSTIITLLPAYLGTLPTGFQLLDVHFSDGVVISDRFEVLNRGTGTPDTGSVAHEGASVAVVAGLGAAVVFGSLFGLVWCLRRRRN